MKRKISTIVLTALFSAVLVTGCGANQVDTDSKSEGETSVKSVKSVTKEAEITEEPTKQAKKSEDEIKKKINIEAKPTLDGEVCVFITNNSEEVIEDLEVQVNYYDESKNVIDLDEDGHDVILPGYTVVSKMDAPDEYDSLDTSFTIDMESYGYENHSNMCEVKGNIGDEGVIVQITNKSSVDIEEAEYIVVYYLNDEIAHVSYPEDVYDIASGETATEKDSVYGFEYDRAEIYLNQAHTFDTSTQTKTDVTASPLTKFPVEITKDTNASETNEDENTSSGGGISVDLVEKVSASQQSQSDVSIGQRNALSTAQSYLKVLPFSYTGLIEQLEYEGYSTEEATYGADNCGADWNEQAAKCAQNYIDVMSFSRQGLIDQLIYEGYTSEQAEYGVSAVGY